MTPPTDASIAALFGLQNKVAVVTGGGAGIGRSVAQLFVKAGARVVVADVNAAAAVVVAGELNSKSAGTAVAIPCDVSSESSVVDLFEAALKQFGSVDVLVNVAGIYPKTPFLETPVEKWDRVHAVNLRGTFLCMREAIKRMKVAGNGGSIVNISSVASLQPVIYDNGDYGATKAGVNNLTKTAAYEFAADKIRVNAVLPGGVATERAMQSVSGKTATGPITQPGRMPLGRIGEAEDIAQAVLFLASGASSYITGQLLAVDGGFQVS
jgi:NAD(P)-dependent dehydrogenase (short-subunit alcohol dehydrogenase family)